MEQKPIDLTGRRAPPAGRLSNAPWPLANASMTDGRRKMHFMDMEDGDICFSTSNNMAMDSEGHMMMRMGDSMAMDMDSGELHMVSNWDDDDDE